MQPKYTFQFRPSAQNPKGPSNPAPLQGGRPRPPAGGGPWLPSAPEEAGAQIWRPLNGPAVAKTWQDDCNFSPVMVQYCKKGGVRVRRLLLAVLCLLLFTLPVWGAEAENTMEVTAVVNGDGSCRMAVKLVLDLDGPERLVLPVGSGAQDATVNGAAAKVQRLDNIPGLGAGKPRRIPGRSDLHPHLHPPLLHPGGGIANPPPAPGPGGPGLPRRPADLPGDPPWRFLGDAVLHQRLLWGRRGQLHDRLHLRPRDCRLSEHRPAGSGQPDPHHGGLPGPLPPELPGGQALRHSPPGRPGLWPPGPAVLAASAAVAAGAGGGSGPRPRWGWAPGRWAAASWPGARTCPSWWCPGLSWGTSSSTWARTGR